MTNPAKAKGSQYERDVAKYFNENGFPFVERRGLAGQQFDKGDLTGIPGLVMELKNHKTLNLAGWIGEAEKERENAKAKFGVVIAKRRGKGAADSYVVMTLKTFIEILED